jgi:hypothetical protein
VLPGQYGTKRSEGDSSFKGRKAKCQGGEEGGLSVDEFLYLAAMRACHSSTHVRRKISRSDGQGGELRINGLRQMTGQVIGHVGRQYYYCLCSIGWLVKGLKMCGVQHRSVERKGAVKVPSKAATKAVV